MNALFVVVCLLSSRSLSIVSEQYEHNRDWSRAAHSPHRFAGLNSHRSQWQRHRLPLSGSLLQLQFSEFPHPQSVCHHYKGIYSFVFLTACVLHNINLHVCVARVSTVWRSDHQLHVFVRVAHSIHFSWSLDGWRGKSTHITNLFYYNFSLQFNTKVSLWCWFIPLIFLLTDVLPIRYVLSKKRQPVWMHEYAILYKHHPASQLTPDVMLSRSNIKWITLCKKSFFFFFL